MWIVEHMPRIGNFRISKSNIANKAEGEHNQPHIDPTSKHNKDNWSSDIQQLN